jgi:hypothetical protein
MLGRHPTCGSRPVGTDPTSIWERGKPRGRRLATPGAVPTATAARRPVEDRPAAPVRLPLKDASKRYAVSISTLRAWSRAGEIDAVMTDGPQGRQWMATAASVAARKRRKGTPPRPAAGPAPDGKSMLVPRDAWDRLVAQLGNLHQAGQQLAEARERAAKAETEATFLRERLAEMRQERDGLRRRFEGDGAEPAGDAPASATPRRRWSRLLPHRRPRPS